MTREALFKLIDIIQAQGREIMHQRNHDYASDEDPLGNLREIGFHGIVVRLRDKMMRLKAYDERRMRGETDLIQSRDESIRDTLRDISNFGILAEIMLDEETREAKP